MSMTMAAWLTAAALIALVWVVRAVAVYRMAAKRCVLGSRTYDGPPNPAPFVSVIVAAKDEETNIEGCISSLLAQDYPNWEFIAVDDRSTDATPDILARMEAQSEGRLNVLRVSRLRDGWFGKNNAMREGIAVSRGEWLMFTDADCTFHAPTALSMAMREAMAHEADFLSITPTLETPTWWERFLQPVCAMVLMARFLPHRVNKPDRKTAYANGAFILMTRDAYQHIGGHERVKTQVNEDICMAGFAKQAGLSLRVVENDDLLSTRMYESPMAAFRGWSRIFYGSFPGALRLLTLAMMLTIFSIVPWISLATAAAGRLQATANAASWWNFSLLAWLGVVLLEQAVIVCGYTMMRMPLRWSLTYPLSCILAVAMLINASLKAAGASRTTWRGTTYRLNERLDDAPNVSTRESHPESMPAPVARGVE